LVFNHSPTHLPHACHSSPSLYTTPLLNAFTCHSIPTLMELVTLGFLSDSQHTNQGPLLLREVPYHTLRCFLEIQPMGAPSQTLLSLCTKSFTRIHSWLDNPYSASQSHHIQLRRVSA
ncbi:hypothetical protein BT96DRAFT_1105615, partial [Gymnopus androsaceus JB14]